MVIELRRRQKQKKPCRAITDLKLVELGDNHAVQREGQVHRAAQEHNELYGLVAISTLDALEHLGIVQRLGRAVDGLSRCDVTGTYASLITKG